MKKRLIFLALVLIGQCYGQVIYSSEKKINNTTEVSPVAPSKEQVREVKNGGKPPILPYGTYSVAQAQEATEKNTVQGYEIRKNLIRMFNDNFLELGINERLTEDSYLWVFDSTQVQEVWLEAGRWKNSRWTSMQKDNVEFYTSDSRYEGNAGVFIYRANGKYYSFPWYKESCFNFIDVISLPKAIALNKEKSNTVLVPDSIYSGVRIDTVYVPTWMENPQKEIVKEVVYVETQPTSDYGYSAYYGYQYSLSYGSMNYTPSYGWFGYNNYCYSCYQPVCSSNMYHYEDNYYNYNYNYNSNSNYYESPKPEDGRGIDPPDLPGDGGAGIDPNPPDGGAGVDPSSRGNNSAGIDPSGKQTNSSSSQPGTQTSRSLEPLSAPKSLQRSAQTQRQPAQQQMQRSAQTQRQPAQQQMQRSAQTQRQQPTRTQSSRR